MVAKINAQRETHSRDIISYAYSRGRLDGSHHSVPVLCQEHVLHGIEVTLYHYAQIYHFPLLQMCVVCTGII